MTNISITAAAPGAYRSIVRLDRAKSTYRLQWFPVALWRLDEAGEAHPVLAAGSDAPEGDDEHFGATRMPDGGFVGWGYRFDTVEEWLGKIVPFGFKDESRWSDTPPVMRSAPTVEPFSPAAFRPAKKPAAYKPAQPLRASR
jgi:hypothetical protein